MRFLYVVFNGLLDGVRNRAIDANWYDPRECECTRAYVRAYELAMRIVHPRTPHESQFRGQGYTRADERSYERHCEEALAEFEAQQAAGGRTVCPSCSHRSVVHHDVITLGYAGHPGAEHSDYGKCEREECGHAEL
jgi:hypothetical protein